jgi:SET domain-containing protein
MPAISANKPYRVGRSKTGLGLFATKKIKKGTKIIRYFGPMLDCNKPKDDAIENKYLFQITKRWTIDGSVRKNIARYANHACRPNAESDVSKKKLRVDIVAIKTIQPGEEITYDYGTDYFKEYLKPIGCLCDHCVKKRKKKAAEARAEKMRLKLKAEKKAAKKREKQRAKAAKTKSKLILSGKANAHARGTGKPSKTKASRGSSLRARKSPASSRRALAD